MCNNQIKYLPFTAHTMFILKVLYSAAVIVFSRAIPLLVSLHKYQLRKRYEGGGGGGQKSLKKRYVIVEQLHTDLCRAGPPMGAQNTKQGLFLYLGSLTSLYKEVE